MNWSRAPKFLTLTVSLGLLLLAPRLASAGSTNTTAATARHLVPDGGYEEDVIDNTNTQAWFSIPISLNHAYSIEAYVPFAVNGSTAVPSLDIGVFEADGTTDITPAADEFFKQPGLDEEQSEGGDRKTLGNFTGDRFVRLVIRGRAAATPPGPITFHLRVSDLTQTAARWTTNGYRMQIALNNSSRQAATGFVDYFAEDGSLQGFDAFTVPADGSTQFVHAASVTIGTALFGGIRVVPTGGAPGVITAFEYNFNPAVSNYLFFPFNSRQWVTATPPQ